MTSVTCKDCKYWTVPDDLTNVRSDTICRPLDSENDYKPMVLPWEVRECKHPELLFCERPLTRDGFAVADGSTFDAGLFTAPDFGCVRGAVNEDVGGSK